MIIKTNSGNNPNIMNFIFEQKIAVSTIEAADAKSLRKSPLAEALFDIGEIRSVLISSEMVSVTKEDKASWEELKPQVLAEIMDFLTTGKNAALNVAEEKSTSDIVAQISGLIEARIRPAIMQDGGDIEFKSFEDGVVTVELHGNCVGCAYAMITLKDGVEKLLKTYIPEVKEVRSFDKEFA